jgi:hypothetical protein
MPPRTYPPGSHAVEVVVNGNVAARGEFILKPDADPLARAIETGRPAGPLTQ